MKKRYCPECGAEIYVTWHVPQECYSATFEITKEGLKRNDNNDIYSPELIFHCSDDMEHNVNPDPQNKEEFSKWLDWTSKIEDNFRSVEYPKM